MDTDLLRALLAQAHAHALEYIDGVDERPVFPTAQALAGLAAFDEPLPERGADPFETLERLHRDGGPATVAQTGGRYFGFVNGGVRPAALAARWLADVWDQNACMWVASPVAAHLEQLCERWVVDLLSLPRGTCAGFVSGTAVSLIVGLAAARNALLARQGWDVAANGLFGAPEIRVVLGEEAHSTVARALSVLGLGRDRVERVACDAQGALLLDALPPLDANTLVILAAGNVASGAFDPIRAVCERAAAAGAWTHVDGAFGLWAAANPATARLTDGLELADSWSADAHKTLNAPYDCGLVLCRDRDLLAGALQMDGAYLQWGDGQSDDEGADRQTRRDGMRFTPEMSRRARGIELWALLRTTGRLGVAELVEGLCARAREFRDGLGAAGFRILNDVVFNQVLVACDSEAQTRATLAAVQDSGELWCGSTVWHGVFAIRVSVCSAVTTSADVTRSVAAFVEARDLAPPTSG